MHSRRILFLVLSALLLLRAATPATVMVRERSANITTTPDGARLLVANADSSSISVIETAGRRVIAEIGLGCTPQTLIADNARAVVACRDGRLSVVDLEQLRVGQQDRVGIEPYGVVSDGARLFVTDFGASEVLVFDAVTLGRLGSVATEPYPRGMTLDRAAARLYVTHFRTGRMTIIDTSALSVVRVIATSLDSNLSQAVTIAGNRAYLPQTRSNSGNAALLFDTTVFPVVSVIDLAAGQHEPRERFSIDTVDKPSNMPADAVVTASGKLYVVHAGSDDLSVIDIARRRTLAHLSVGANPRGIALAPDERLAFVNNALSGTVSVIDTATDQVVETLGVTTLPLGPRLLNGKILFHSAVRPALAKDRWISCATCHFEGGADGRTWLFRDGPRNTTALFGVASTMPMHWSGDLDELHDVEQTIRVIQAGTGLAEGEGNCTPACDQAPRNTGRSQDLDDLAHFMFTLRAAHREIPLTDAARRGEALFHGVAACGSCHPAPLFTDRKKHDVGTGMGEKERKGSSFDTPSLRGLFDTAPYLHDGSAPTLREAVTRHTNASALSPSDLDDLVAFLESIPFPQPRRRAAP
jgi:YVTN family beta-propeller protein